ncbi:MULTISPECIES: LLM class flavin-dependent oxidoreductase [unclassified Corynebacterium]|uniref:LLM class flavin-dependent oxidoreductase n=1 Tax=unclassified Corynebacterium TaxID=2624378 RepID=UPI0021AA4C39|nr:MULTISPECIES: LLM class flavin-dependent oxidoreductase [unclassified Corynebacterium]MCT1452645.1 LLM class flavin-dependent oxidoreductase [Corynebacterium sp. p3-SID1145]MCT1461547.1 LLM class flavin-dependent oxidoreductase [Corynebacterium sp. p3-SID1140]MDN8594551.1 LLM class flavin-dependent oxidoreductase [Corynebacterium sp. P4_F2]WKK55603.1 LLM class flavin-dependent oxidoreductase [Corynebacterium sp. P4-C1]WKK63013.1 LLM class flavin-dependent oxidoreductase [Corynebacterium sp.
MTPLSLLDFCTVRDDETPGQSMARSVELAQTAEKLGYDRVWYAEHHNMPSIASSSPAVLISHIAAKTEKIRLGAGGVMLPNHSPYVIAEQFGMLAELYPDRIDLGLGRAPGTDQNTLGRALRRDPMAAENFPDDVLELQGYLAGNSVVPGVTAMPGAGTNVPLYILGSSMFGATLAAKLGLPYSFASHFAPTHLEAATTYYRENYQPSERHPEPYVIAAVNVTASDSAADAARQTELVHRARVRALLGRQGRTLTEEQLDNVMASPQGQQIVGMLRYTAQGTGEQVADYLENFAAHAKADELMVSFQSPTHDEAVRAMEIVSGAV